jgi:hypothetical protein
LQVIADTFGFFAASSCKKHQQCQWQQPVQ